MLSCDGETCWRLPLFPPVVSLGEPRGECAGGSSALQREGSAGMEPSLSAKVS